MNTFKWAWLLLVGAATTLGCTACTGVDTNCPVTTVWDESLNKCVPQAAGGAGVGGSGVGGGGTAGSGNTSGTAGNGGAGGGADCTPNDPCNTGLLGVCGNGTCTPDGQSCVPVTIPSGEICDGFDNDCDGTVDEGCSGCTPNDPCDTGLLGVCGSGVCNAAGTQCVQSTQSSPEVCNDGLDNDCDGTVDEGCSTTCDPNDPCNTGLLGVCGPGLCSGDGLQCNQVTQSSPEVCNDGLDNDCNGVVDNGCTGCSTNCALQTADCGSCDGVCDDVWFSEAHCGYGCEVCGAGEICSYGQCIADNPDCNLGCAPGTGDCNCDGLCESLQTDTQNCGQCGHTCAGNEACVGGACVPDNGNCNLGCAPGTGDCDCDGICESLMTDEQNCGQCTHICAASDACIGGACINNSGCNLGCAANSADCNCDGICENLLNNSQNCGACNNPCQANFVCTGNTCVPDNGGCNMGCAAGSADCDCNGSCSSLLSDQQNCGLCGNACPANTVCTGGACIPTGGNCAVCGVNQEDCDCDGDCEDLFADSQNCNGCGIVCAPGDFCSFGQCVLDCPLGQVDCFGVCSNTDLDVNNCHACGNVCAPGEVCTPSGCGIAPACINGATQICGTNAGECTYGTQTCAGGQWGACVGGVQPSTELCDGLDNNCNGTIDEGCTGCVENSTLPCGTSTGECSQGIQTCSNGVWSQCVGAVGPTNETCDGTDNNCNGVADEGCLCQNGQTQTCGTNVGACQFGVSTCNNNAWGPCVGEVGPVAESCNSLDDNCNGLIDDGAGCVCVDDSTLPCGSSIGACSFGVVTCTNGQWGACVGGVLPTAEVCNGIDDDCNGQIDEGLVGCVCTNGETQVCGSNVGTCSTGITTCNSGMWGPCVGEVGPVNEVCDNLDNNCDGLPDNGIACVCQSGSTLPCGSNVGACSFGVMTCNGGSWGACVGGVNPTTETCNNIDDDCNGIVDDGLASCVCIPGSTQTCGSNIGACSFGVMTCDATGTWGACQGNIGPQPESCNNIDDDCDGQIDEGLASCICTNGATQVCGSAIGQCQQGVQTCSGNVWGACVGSIGPQAEMCDNLDNDCDGVADNGVSCVCQNGSTQLCGSSVGACSPGVQTCVGGAWGSCQGGVGPQVEACNGLDDDCDGQIDEGLVGCVCQNGATQVCGSAIGQCQQGIQTCSGNAWSACVGSVGPQPEVCDNLDNDCDGQIDNGLVCACQNGSQQLCGSSVGACSQGVQTCTSGAWGACIGAVGPQAESCNNVDDDCDGQVDEGLVGCVCQNGQTQVCGTSVGTCQPGLRTCSGNVWGSCIGAVGPQPESCNNQDDDCNGLVDDNAGCVCVNGSQQVCGSNVGACSSGITTCGGGLWGPCVGEVGPANETCNNIDDDCDGLVDEGAGCVCVNGQQQPCGSNVGQCQFGTMTCVSGQWGICVGGVQPTAEICGDGLDQDCDGIADDGCIGMGSLSWQPDGCSKSALFNVSDVIIPAASSQNNQQCEVFIITGSPVAGDTYYAWDDDGTIVFVSTIPISPANITIKCSDVTNLSPGSFAPNWGEMLLDHVNGGFAAANVNQVGNVYTLSGLSGCNNSFAFEVSF